MPFRHALAGPAIALLALLAASPAQVVGPGTVAFIPPSPCGQVLPAAVGIPFSFTVAAQATTGLPTDTVVLASGPLPPGAAMGPSLPTFATGANATATSTFTWTPTAGDVGVVAIGFFAQAASGEVVGCTVAVNVVGIPTFLPPSPCGTTLNASVGVPLSYTMSVSTGGTLVNLLSGPLPGTATHNPPLPLLAQGTPANAISTFTWTPTQADVGTHYVTYFAFNKFGQATPCQVTILVGECYLLLGEVSANRSLGGNDTMLVDAIWWAPVTMESIPQVYITDSPVFHGMHVYAQIGMFNPDVFPNDPLQLTHGLDITIGVGATPYGNSGSGMTLSLVNPPTLGSTLRFAFTIPGM